MASRWVLGPTVVSTTVKRTTERKNKRSDKGKRPKRRNTPEIRAWRRAAGLVLEMSGLVASALVAVIAALGQAALHLGGVGFWSNLLPFAAVVLALTLMGALLLGFWLRLRILLVSHWPYWPAALALAIAAGAGWCAAQVEFARNVRALRSLVGGVQEAERVTVSHQVFAAYRRSDLTQMQKLLNRAQPFLPFITEAAEKYEIDPAVLVGVAAAESSFLPRDSQDGGRGLFQITAPPQAAVSAAKDRLGVANLDLADPKHNAHVAAATLSRYLQEMRGDLFLGLLAYNIGPKNGGLLSIMRQYGARDFATIQPYLQNLPRDYPIRVLCAALAYRIWHDEGQLMRYEEGDNALRIQRLGIPGLEAG